MHTSKLEAKPTRKLLTLNSKAYFTLKMNTKAYLC